MESGMVVDLPGGGRTTTSWNYKSYDYDLVLLEW